MSRSPNHTPKGEAAAVTVWSGKHAAFRSITGRQAEDRATRSVAGAASGFDAKGTVGTLIYGRTQEYDFDERTLEHLRIVITSRVRKNESFFLTWTAQRHRQTVTTSLWISPAVPLVFSFSSDTRVPISREWLQQLIRSSYSSQGLVIMPEPASGGF